MNTLFDRTIEVNSMDDLKTINNETALLIIEKSINYANMRGLFTLDESYVLFNCLLKLKEVNVTPNEQ